MAPSKNTKSKRFRCASPEVTGSPGAGGGQVGLQKNSELERAECGFMSEALE